MNRLARQLLGEALSKTDLASFYAIEYAGVGGPVAEYHVGLVWEDLMIQLGKMVLGRIIPDEPGAWRDPVGPPTGERDEEGRDNVDRLYDEKMDQAMEHWLSWHAEWRMAVPRSGLSLQELAAAIEHFVEWPTESGRGDYQYFTAGDGVWRGLADTFRSMLPHSSLKSRILDVDRIMGLAHHGGGITDYMDEHKWIVPFLDWRKKASPREIWAASSDAVKDAIDPPHMGNRVESLAEHLLEEDTGAGAFFADVQAMGTQMDRNLVLDDYDVVVELSPQGDGARLNAISTFGQTGQGSAGSAMRAILALADKHGVTMHLGAEPFGGEEMDAAQLMAWYSRLGFQPSGRGSEMTRPPAGAKPKVIQLRGFPDRPH